jgi:two-component system, NarL family, sensor histidine kinase DevS
LPEAGAADPARLAFPDAPRLELDQLLDQLVGRATEVRAAQGRLRGLLRANQLIITDLGLQPVLLRIVEAARELVGARYAALGVLSPDGGLAEFVHSGMPADDVRRIGHLPQGKGLLGALIDDPQPIRLHDIGADPRSSGFPSEHPPMHSFLGVPIRIRGEVFGNLYLSESIRGDFSAEDEELTKSLAATAAAAIDNARLYESSQTQAEWRQAATSIVRQMMSADADDPLHLIAERCREIAHADLVVISLPTANRAGLQVRVAVGVGADLLHGTEALPETSLVGEVFRAGEAIRLARHDEISELMPEHPDLPVFSSVLVVPLLGTNSVRGVLTAARVRDRTPFTAAALEGASGFVNQAVLTLELAQARAEQRRAEMFDERERIAADLHDHVIQRLFGAGLALQGVAATLGQGRNADRVLATIKDLDETISQIRTTIFQLQLDGQTTQRGLRAAVLDVVAEATPALGFDPAVRFAGVLEGTVADDLADDLLAVVREALSNVARHAHATSVEVEVAAENGALRLHVSDNGTGLQAGSRRSGLANLERRARLRGGTMSLEPRSPSGTRLSWSAQISDG